MMEVVKSCLHQTIETVLYHASQQRMLALLPKNEIFYSRARSCILMSLSLQPRISNAFDDDKEYKTWYVQHPIPPHPCHRYSCFQLYKLHINMRQKVWEIQKMLWWSKWCQYDPLKAVPCSTNRKTYTHISLKKKPPQKNQSHNHVKTNCPQTYSRSTQEPHILHLRKYLGLKDRLVWSELWSFWSGSANDRFSSES